MDLRRAMPVVVATVVVGTLFYFTWKHGDAKPIEDPDAVKAAGPGGAVNKYEMSGKDQRLAGEEPAALPPGHPVIGGGQPATGVPADGVKGPTVPAGTASSEEGIPLTYVVPAGWAKQSPSNTMRLAQWGLSAEAGGKPGEVYVATAGGDVASNVARWVKQMGQTKPDKTTELTVAGMRVTRVDVTGTFAGMSGPGAPAASPESGYRLLGAVVETGDVLTFVKATGPAAVMAREEMAFDAFLASLKPR